MNSVSLAGSLEDLALNDILQILSLSRKSGVLRLSHEHMSLELFIDSGNVVAARPHPSIASLHQFFRESAQLPPDQLEQFLSVVREKSFRPQAWAPFWADKLQADVDTARGWAKQYLVWLVGRAQQWEVGDFSFELDPNRKRLDKVIQVPVFPSFEDGLSTQFLLMEGARIADESAASRSDEELGDQTITGMVPGMAVPQGRAEQLAGTVERILLVGDKPERLRRVADSLRKQGYAVVAEARGIDAAIETLDRSEGGTWTVVADLVMPKRDRSGVLGGIELTEEISSRREVAAVYLCSDIQNPQIQEQLDGVGAAGLIAMPPRKSWKTQSDEALERFVRGIVESIGSPAATETASEPEPELDDPSGGGDINLDDPLAALLAEDDLDVGGVPERDDHGMRLLRQMMEELTSPDAHADVSLMILRFASDFFQRSIIFAVGPQYLRGLGQVGLSIDNADTVVRNLSIELGQKTVFDWVIEHRQSFVGPPPEHRQHSQFFARLSGAEPAEVFVAPVLAGGKMVAMLYADQVPTQVQIRDTETVEIFLAQAGLALERAYLRRQLEERNQHYGSDAPDS